MRLDGLTLSAIVDPASPPTTWVTVTGIWSGQAIRVEEQSFDRPSPPRRQAWSRPPCPPPAGGWSTVAAGDHSDSLDFDLGDLQDTGAAVTVTVFRPAPAVAILVVAASDETAVEQKLRPELGPRLCVTPSRWPKRQLDEVSKSLTEHMQDWTIGAVEQTADEEGQAVITVTVVRVTGDMARWVSELPNGLLNIIPCLVPAP